MGYNQWVEVTINNINCNSLTIRNAHHEYGKFYELNDKDKEIKANDINKIVIPKGQNATICSCGRYISPTGTEGSFDVYDDQTKIGNYSWDCPFGSSYNKSLWSRSRYDGYIVHTSRASNGGAIGKVYITIDYMKFRNKWDFYKIDNVKQTLDLIDKSGVFYVFDTDRVPSSLHLYSHIQGVARYNGYMIITHNSEMSVSDHGYFIVVKEESNEVIYTPDTPNPGYPHPGGIQQIGDYLALSLENDVNSRIRFYDLSQMSDTEFPDPLETEIVRDNAKAGAVGITVSREDGIDYFFVAVHDNGKVDFYKSNGKSLSDPQCRFGLICSANVGSVDNLCLVTECTTSSEQAERIYMIGLRSTPPSDPSEDYMDITSVQFSKNMPDSITVRYFCLSYELIVALGVHFRYGAGIEVVSPQQINVIATGRQTNRGIYTNLFSYFIPKH